MILHAVLVTLQSFVTVLTSIYPYIGVLYQKQDLIGLILIVIDVIVQLMICYICLTVGSHEHLRKIQITLDMT